MMDIVKMRYSYRKLIGLTEYEEGSYTITDVLVDRYGESRVIREYVNFKESLTVERKEDVTELYGKL